MEKVSDVREEEEAMKYSIWKDVAIFMVMLLFLLWLVQITNMPWPVSIPVGFVAGRGFVKLSDWLFREERKR